MCLSPVYCRTETQREGIKEEEGKRREEGAWEKEEAGEGKENACAHTPYGILSSSLEFIAREVVPDFPTAQWGNNLICLQCSV